METNEYREALVDTVNKLLDIQETLFDSLFQLSLYGERKDLASGPSGEVITFSKALFADSKDENIQLLTALLTQAENACDAICATNEIEVVNAEEDYDDEEDEEG